MQINCENEYEVLKDDIKRWNKYNNELLIRIFSNDSFDRVYSRAYGGVFLMNQGWRYWCNEEKKYS